MPIHRRELFRQCSAAAIATALPPSLLASAAAAQPDSPARPVRLNRNESAYGPSEKTRDAFVESWTESNRYPADDLDALRAAIASFHNVRPENITLGCGSGELLRMSAEAFLSPGKALVTPTPTFDAVARAAQLLPAEARVEVRAVPLTNVLAHDLDAMLAQSRSGAGLVYICNPNNPTGTLTPKPDLESFLSRVTDKVPPGVPILIDEAYHDYVAPAGAYASFLSRAAADPRLIVTRTFSKIYGLAGLRIGYAVSAPETAKLLAARRLAMGVNVVAARVALAAFADQPYVSKIAARNADDRQEFLNQANSRMLRAIQSHANFALLAAGALGTEVAAQLRARGVLVSAGYPAFPNHIRVSFGLPADMRRFWTAWDSVIPSNPM
jgi:histidinol-phosphate aminotransferase